jgi:hypothetical protein
LADSQPEILEERWKEPFSTATKHTEKQRMLVDRPRDEKRDKQQELLRTTRREGGMGVRWVFVVYTFYTH